MSVFYDRDDRDHCKRATELHRALREKSAALGFQEYRMGLGSIADAMSNRPDYQRFIGAIKKALDPQGVLAPGRYGVGQP